MIDIYKMASYFRRRAKEEGFPDLCLAFQFPAYYSDMYYRNDIFDYQIEFELYIHEISKARSCLEQAEKFL